VYYATDRLEIRTEETVQYGGERSEDGRLSYGECEISIPKAHKVGELESPSLFRLELRPNPEKHVTIATIATLAESEFLKAVAEVVGQSESREAFVFVHGFNVTFEDAARRAGQIAFDLQFAGAPLLYSWPSLGKVGDYLVDGNNITWSTPHFVRFLELLAAHSGAARIHIIAHSMGNRAVCDAIKTLSASRGLVVNHLVLAAPDIDAATFCELAGALRAGSRHITLYASSEDKALKLARKIHGHPRAGEPMLILPGLDSIDASAIETDFLSHSYFGNNWPLLSDIHALLSHDTPPAERFGLTEVKDERGKYYTFRRS
jgi:esterase/lipase superfamily enzyme